MKEQIEKQAIEEMANDLMICHVEFGEDDDIRTDYDATATMLYRDKGYRKQEWISVEDRLPENDTTVLCYNGVINTYTYECKNKWWADSCWDTTKGFGITHWMPLPEPPKMKGGAE